MLTTSLTLALLAASLGTVDDDRLMDLFAPGSGIIVRVADTSALLASDDPGAWLATLAAPDVQRALRAFLGDIGAPNEESGAELLALLAACRGGVFAVPTGYEGLVIGALRADASFRASLDAALLNSETALVERQFAGREALVAVLPDGWLVSLVTAGELTLIYLGPEDVAEPVFTEYAGRLDLDDVAEGWWRGVPRRVDDPLIEGFLDPLAFVVDDESDVDLSRYLGVGYIGLSACQDVACATLFSLKFGEDKFLREVAKSFRSCDPAFFGLAPKGVEQATFIGLDVVALVESSIALVSDLDPDAAEMVEGGIGAGNAALGLDVMEELLPALTGDFAFFAWPDEQMAELFSEEPALPTIAVGIADSEVILTLMESIEALMGGGLNVEDGDDRTTWTLDPALGVEVTAVLTETLFVIGAPERVASVMARTGETTTAGMIDAAMRKTLGGVDWITVQDVSVTWEMLDGGFGALAMSGVGEGELDSLMDLIDGVLGVLAGRFSGLSISRIRIDPSGISIRSSIR